jgi:thymidylate synthase (FAD)
MSELKVDTKELPIKKVWLPDGIGFVELIGTFGDDLTVVNAARVSFDKTSLSLTEADKKLIKYLAKHEHTSPFFHPQVRFRIKMPIFVAREWYRHTIGFARNEVSRRYVDSKPECWVPSAESIRERDPKVKQGSKDTAIDNAVEVEESLRKHVDDTLALYNTLLENKVAPEVARCILPQSMYTEFIETASLAAVARLCGLRLGADAQKEIRDYATIVHGLMLDIFPVSWASLDQSDYSD